MHVNKLNQCSPNFFWHFFTVTETHCTEYTHILRSKRSKAVRKLGQEFFLLSGRGLNGTRYTLQFCMEETGQEGRPEWQTDGLGLLGLTKNFQSDFRIFLSSTCLLRSFFVQQGLNCSGNPAVMQTWCTNCISTASISPTSRPSHVRHPEVWINTCSRNL